MKFSDGFWLNKRGYEVSYASQAYEIKTGKNFINVLAPSSYIQNRGMTLGGPVLDVTFSSTQKDVIKVSIDHFKGGLDNMRLRPWALEDLLCSRTLPALSAVTLDGEQIGNLFQGDGRPTLAFWLEEGGEPTEHVLNELMERGEAIAELPVRVLFLVRGRDSLRQSTLARALECLRGVQVLLDDWAYDLEAVARHLGRDPDSPPLAVVCGGAGQAVYSDCGYRVGAVELLLRILKHLAEKQ